MPRLDGLIELIQTTNEVYFITAPGRIRTAYILVDDITELALKTYLQEQTLQQREQCINNLTTAGIISNNSSNRTSLRRYFNEELAFNDLCNVLHIQTQTDRTALQTRMSTFSDLQHWSVNDSESRRNFNEVIDSVRDFLRRASTANDAPIWVLLNNVLDSHRTRNKLYHDHQQSEFTINDVRCLRALCDLFSLMEQLFPDFLENIKTNKVIRCQIGVLRLKLEAHGDDEQLKPYYNALNQLSKNRVVGRYAANYEHTIVHTVTEGFFFALKAELRNKIDQLGARVDIIDRMTRKSVNHDTERSINTHLILTLTKQLEVIDNLVNLP